MGVLCDVALDPSPRTAMRVIRDGYRHDETVAILQRQAIVQPRRAATSIAPSEH